MNCTLFEADGWAENAIVIDDVDVEVDTDVEVDFVETEVEINVEAAIIVGDETGKVAKILKSKIW